MALHRHTPKQRKAIRAKRKIAPRRKGKNTKR